METIIDFIKSMTLWNWFQIVALSMTAILFLPSAISHWLNLYPRLKNWRVTKSKEGFEKRLQELEILIYQAGAFKTSPSDFFIEILDISLRGIKSLLVAIGLLIFALLQGVAALTSSGSTLNLIAAFMLFFAFLLFATTPIKSLKKASDLTEAVRHPYINALELIKIIKDARSKDWISEEEAKYKIDYMIRREIFDESIKQVLQEKMDGLRLKS